MGSCYYGMTLLRVTDGEDGLQIRWLPANILNKQSWQPRRGGPPAWWLGEGLTTPRRKKKSLLRNVTQGLGIGGLLW